MILYHIYVLCPRGTDCKLNLKKKDLLSGFLIGRYIKLVPI